MNKFKILLFGFVLSSSNIVSAQQAEIIAIETKNTSLVYSIDKQNRLLFQHYGNRVKSTPEFGNRQFIQVYITNRTFSYEALNVFRTVITLKDAVYKIQEINQSGTKRFWDDGLDFTGEFLLNTGIDVSV